MTLQHVIELEHRDDLCILRLTGCLSFGRHMEDLRAVKNEMASRSCSKLLVDVSAIPFITSVEIGFLVGLYSSITALAKGRYVLVGPNPLVRRILDLTRLSAVIPMVADIPSGLAIIHEHPALATAQSA